MTYDETVDYLFNCAPPFQQVGGAAYKEGLANSIALDNHLGNPHRRYRTIHVAGTNGKGSTSHTLAAILQAAGYKVGLYTSPHLIDFRERIRVNGKPVDKQFVVDFVERERDFFEPLKPSFFELTTAMAFSYFAQEEVDIAVIEVGLGGRLDCTNIITPELCIITNISPDHTQFLGNTIGEIAAEKAGIIKKDIPVIIGETTEEMRKVFTQKAQQEGAPITFAEENSHILQATHSSKGIEYTTRYHERITGELRGDYQVKNANTILAAVHALLKKGYKITVDNIRTGFANVCSLTGFMGRWQTISNAPRTICDAGHNVGGIKHVTEQLAHEQYTTLRIVFGMVGDKDINSVLAMMPRNAIYYFTQASIKRALPADKLREMAKEHGLLGSIHPDVASALAAATNDSAAGDLIFVGGSCFVVADLLASINRQSDL
ncbi:MAG: bifunctional folylpolyglutamate synthase/dihydrofolate synthase [Bacteroidaceae bacterium]|nr:bifunctional folylpolyglutamate synthase/dihydrofolate synthase [Bacteroidaceae bacterium]